MTKEELEKEARFYTKGWKEQENCVQAYLASAKPREKRIAELEKRCANYEMALSKMEKGTCDVCKEIEKDKRLEELKKENAELKGLVNQYKAGKCGSISLVNRNMIMFDQLTKAKELLKDITSSYGSTEVSEAQLYLKIKKAEQFLKDSEVEK